MDRCYGGRWGLEFSVPRGYWLSESCLKEEAPNVELLGLPSVDA